MRVVAVRERDETGLDDAEARLRDFLEVSSDWIWETDAALRFSFFSESLDGILGAENAALLGKTRAEIIENPDLPEVRRHLAELDARRPFRGFTYSTQTARGRRWFRISGKPVFDRAGKF